MVKRSRTPAANSRNSQRSLRNQRARRRYGSDTPTDEQIRAREASERGARFSRARVAAAEAKKPATTKPTTKKPKATKPKTIKPKTTKKKPKAKKEKPSLTQYLSEQTPVNARNTISNLSGRGNTSGRITARDSYTTSGRRTRKSLDEIQGFLQGMNQIIKNEQSTQARMTGNNLNTKIRQQKQEGSIRDKPKEVKTGDKFNLETRIGDAATKATCRLWKTELNDTFNTLLDNFQHLYKDYETDKFNEAEGKGKKKPITNTGRSGKGSLGGDTQATPSALGTTRSDQQVMQS
jgi:hypothetical protein